MRFLAIIIATALLLGSQTARAAGDITLEESELRFAALLRADGTSLAVTPPQSLYLERRGVGRNPCQVTSGSSWINVTPQHPLAPGTITVEIDPAELDLAAGAHEGEVLVRCGAEAAQHLRVLLKVLTESSPPFGFWDAPSPGAIRIGDQPVPLNGWALDDVGVAEVRVCFEPAERPPCGPDSRVVGSAHFGYHTRPDVLSGREEWPLAIRSGWSFQISRRDVPNDAAGQLSVVATDIEGHQAVLGTRAMVIDAAPGPWREPLGFLRRLILLGVIFSMIHGAVLIWIRFRAVSMPRDTTPRFQRCSLTEGLLVAAAVIAFGLLNLSRMTRGLEYDELYTASHVVVGIPLWKTATTVVVFNNHIGYSLAANLAVRLFGSAEWVLRLPAFLCGAGSVFMIWQVGRRLVDRRAAVLSAWMLALSPSFATWATLARGYSFLTVAALAATSSFFVLLERRSTKAVVCHASSLILAVYAHLYGIWIAAVQYGLFLWLIVRGTASERLTALWRSFAASAFTLLFLYSPVIPDLIGVLEARGRGALKPQFPLELYSLFASARNPLLLAIMGMLCLIGLTRVSRLVRTYFLLVLALPLVLLWAIARPVDLYPRFFVYWIPVFLLLVAAGAVRVASLRWPVRPVAFVRNLAVVATLLWMALTWVDQQRAPRTDGYRPLLATGLPRQEWPTYGVGGDVQMFDYYLGKPFEWLHSRGDLETAMREHPRVLVAYHAMSWNTPDDKAMAAILSRRCTASPRGAVTLYRCER